MNRNFLLGLVGLICCLMLVAGCGGGGGPKEVTLIDYPMTTQSGDHIHRAFYIEAFPGTSLNRVTLWFSAATDGEYTLQLEARDSTFDGDLIGQSTVTAALTTSFAPVTFAFDFNPVTPGNVVTFTMIKTAGPAAEISFCTYGDYGSLSAEESLLTETVGSVPPLDTFRRYGIAIRVYGEE